MNLEQEIRQAVERQYFYSVDTWRAYATELLAEVDRLRAAALGDGWVSVSERLPEDNDDAMIAAVDNVAQSPFRTYGCYRKGCWYTDSMAASDSYTITHWRPLPPLPAAEVTE